MEQPGVNIENEARVFRLVILLAFAAITLFGAVCFGGGWYARQHCTDDRVHNATAAMQEAVAHNEEAAARAAEDISTSASYQLERDLVATERVRKQVCSDHHARKGK